MSAIKAIYKLTARKRFIIEKIEFLITLCLFVKVCFTSMYDESRSVFKIGYQLSTARKNGSPQQLWCARSSSNSVSSLFMPFLDHFYYYHSI